MVSSQRPYDPPFGSYAHISCRNGAYVHQKRCYLDFDTGNEFGDLESPRLMEAPEKTLMYQRKNFVTKEKIKTSWLLPNVQNETYW